jgi:hypothetical protein
MNRWSLSLVPLLLAGCYRYAGVPVGGVPPAGGAVRVTLADSARTALAPQIGVAGAVLQGEVAAAPDTAGWLALAVTQVTRTNGVDEFWRGERVRVPVAALTRMEVRRFDRRRTALLAAGLAGGVALVRALGGSGASFSGGGSPPGTGGSK